MNELICINVQFCFRPLLNRPWHSVRTNLNYSQTWNVLWVLKVMWLLCLLLHNSGLHKERSDERILFFAALTLAQNMNSLVSQTERGDPAAHDSRSDFTLFQQHGHPWPQLSMHSTFEPMFYTDFLGTSKWLHPIFIVIYKGLNVQ